MNVSEPFLRAGCEEGGMEQEGPGRQGIEWEGEGMREVRDPDSSFQEVYRPFSSWNAFRGKSSVNKMCSPETSLGVFVGGE